MSWNRVWDTELMGKFADRLGVVMGEERAQRNAIRVRVVEIVDPHLGGFSPMEVELWDLFVVRGLAKTRIQGELDGRLQEEGYEWGCTTYGGAQGQFTNRVVPTVAGILRELIPDVPPVPEPPALTLDDVEIIFKAVAADHSEIGAPLSEVETWLGLKIQRYESVGRWRNIVLVLNGQSRTAYVPRDGFSDHYMNSEGPLRLGAPTGNEVWREEHDAIPPRVSQPRRRLGAVLRVRQSDLGMVATSYICSLLAVRLSSSCRQYMGCLCSLRFRAMSSATVVTPKPTEPAIRVGKVETVPPTTPYAIEVNTPRPTADRSLEDDVGVALGPVVINQIQEPLSGLVTAGRAARLPTPSQQIIDRRVAAARIQKTQLSRLSDGLPLRQLQLPRLYEAQLDQSSIEHLADAYVGELNG